MPTSISPPSIGAGCSCACAPTFRSLLGFVLTSITGWRTACARRGSISSNARMHFFGAEHPSNAHAGQRAEYARGEINLPRGLAIGEADKRDDGKHIAGRDDP